MITGRQKRIRGFLALALASALLAGCGVAAQAQTGEELFLRSIKEYTLKGISPADIIIKKWNGVWHKNINKMIDYLN